MANKTITIELTGPAEVIDPSMLAFCKQNGWQETVVIDGQEVENPETKEDKARDVIRAFIMETVKAYNINQAREQAALDAATQTEGAIGLTTLTLTVE